MCCKIKKGPCGVRSSNKSPIIILRGHLLVDVTQLSVRGIHDLEDGSVSENSVRRHRAAKLERI